MVKEHDLIDAFDVCGSQQRFTWWRTLLQKKWGQGHRLDYCLGSKHFGHGGNARFKVYHVNTQTNASDHAPLMVTFTTNEEGNKPITPLRTKKETNTEHEYDPTTQYGPSHDSAAFPNFASFSAHEIINSLQTREQTTNDENEGRESEEDSTSRIESQVVMPFSDCWMNGTKINCLFDSGAHFSLISPEAADQLCEKHAFTTVVDGPSLRGVSGSILRPTKKVEVNLTVADKVIKHTMLVMPSLPIPVIFASDILTKYKADISYRTEQISFIIDNEQKCLPFKLTKMDKYRDKNTLFACNTSILPPGHFVDIKTRTSTEARIYSHDKIAIVQPLPETHLFSTSHCVVTMKKGFCFVRIGNFTTKPLTIRRGKAVAGMDTTTSAEACLAVVRYGAHDKQEEPQTGGNRQGEPQSGEGQELPRGEDRDQEPNREAEDQEPEKGKGQSSRARPREEEDLTGSPTRMDLGDAAAEKLSPTPPQHNTHVNTKQLERTLASLRRIGIDEVRANEIAKKLTDTVRKEEEEREKREADMNDSEINDMFKHPPFSLIDLTRERTACNERQYMKLKRLLVEFADLFDIPRAKNYHDIDFNMRPHRPTYSKPSKESPEQTAAIKEFVKTYEHAGWIEESDAAYGARLVLARRSDGRVRVCVDLRDVNKNVIFDPMPFPRIKDLIAQVNDSTLFSALDCASAFHTLKLTKDASNKTSFVSSLGHHRFRVLPFGYKNAMQIFTRFTKQAFENVRHDCLLSYADDLLVHTKSDANEHLCALRRVFVCFRDAGLSLKPSKLRLLRKRVDFLGFTISDKGHSPTQEKTAALLQIPRPTTRKKVKSLIAIFSYYRHFVPNFTKTVFNLNKLCNAKGPWNGIMNDEENEEYENLRTIFCDPSKNVLRHFDPSKKVWITCDASDYGLGSVCEQMASDDKLHPIHYASRSLTANERKYTIPKKECLALFWSSTVFRPYMTNNQTIFRSDNSVATHMKTQRTGAVATWALHLEGYSYQIRHIPGKKNELADGFSRFPLSSYMAHSYKRTNRKRKREDMAPTEAEENGSPGARAANTQLHTTHAHLGILEPTRTITRMMTPLSEHTVTQEEIRREQEQTMEWMIDSIQRRYEKGDIIHPTQPRELPLPDDWNDKTKEEKERLTKERDIRRHYFMHDGIIMRRNKPNELNTNPFVGRVCVPKPLREKITKQFHGLPITGHLGIRKTMRNISQAYYWENMKDDITKFIDSCVACKAKAGRPDNDGLQQPMLDATSPMSILHVDCQGPLPLSKGFRYLLTCICSFSRFPFAWPIRSRSKEDIIDTLYRNLICVFGVPDILVCDNEGALRSNDMKIIRKTLNIQMKFSNGYNPKHQAFIERFHRHLNAQLKIFTNEYADDWAYLVDSCLWAYRISVCKTSGFSPYHLLFGRSPNIPATLLNCLTSENKGTLPSEYHTIITGALAKAYDLVRARQERAALYNKTKADARRRERFYDVGDFVMIWAPPKRLKKTLDHPSPVCVKYQKFWSGPHTIKRKVNERRYVVEHIERGEIEVSVTRMKLFNPWRFDSEIDGNTFNSETPPTTKQSKHSKGTPSQEPPEEQLADNYSSKAGRDQGAPTPIKGSLCVIAHDDDENEPFIVGRLINVDTHNNNNMVFHLFGNDMNDPCGTYRPGYVDKRDNKHFWTHKKSKHSRYTSDTRGMDINKQNMICYGFDINKNHRLPSHVYKSINASDKTPWTT